MTLDMPRAVEMRRSGRSISDIAEAFNCSETTVSRKLRKLLGEPERTILKHKNGQAARRQEREYGPPAHISADRDRRSTLPPRDLTALLMGDPLPGQSALERNQT